MRIEKKLISELLPAKYNPRKDLKPGDKKYEKLKSSIKEFGYVEPIIWNERTRTVVGGHQRLKVLKELGNEEIECVIVNIDEVHEKALNLALNKVSGEWDKDMLSDLLKSIEDIDITLTGFEIPEIEQINFDEEFGYIGSERERTYDAYRMREFDKTRCEGFYQMPKLKACNYVPDNLISFNYARTHKDKSAGIHFFIDDYQFERIWNRPYENFEIIKKYSCCVTPDFSTYADMSMSMRIYNLYRQRLIGQMMQDYGITVIPNIREIVDFTSDQPKILDFSYDGLPKNSVIVMSTLGIARDKDFSSLFQECINTAINRLEPKTIILFGTDNNYDFKGISVKRIQSRKWKDGEQ